MACPTVTAGGTFLSTLLQHIDCQGQSIGNAGYQAMADPGSPLSIVLTALLTIFIALFGLRMILGAVPSLRDGVLAVIKIGVVLTLATSWPAYRTVVYDVIVRGPAQLTAGLAGPSALPGANGDLVARLQVTDNAISRLTTLGSGRNDLSSVQAVGADGRVLPAERAPVADDLAFGSARVVFLSSVAAAFSLVRLGAGVLLALAPLFAGLLLFDIGRGLFVGWARALVFTLLFSVVATILVAVELAILEPWLSQALRLRNARIITSEAPVELLVICLAFALVLAGSMALLLRLSFMLDVRIPAAVFERARDLFQASEARTPPTSRAPSPGSSERATRVASAVSAAQRREAGARAGASAATSSVIPVPSGMGLSVGAGRSTITSSVGPLRRRRPRQSNASAFRDRSL